MDDSAHTGPDTMATPAETASARGPTPAAASLRYFFVPALLLTGAVAVILYLGSGDTQAFFAWTARDPLTAATMGAGFAAATTLFVISVNRERWADVRLAALAPAPLLAMMLFASVADFDELHVRGPQPVIGLIVGLFWVLAFSVVPAVYVLALGLQFARAHGAAVPHAAPIPVWGRNLLELFACTMSFVGGVFFSAPTTFTNWWPWPVDALDLRGLCAWLVTIGLAAFIAVWEDDLGRLGGPIVAAGVFGVLELGGIALYHDHLDWQRPATWIFVLLTVALLAIPVVGLELVRRERSTTPFVRRLFPELAGNPGAESLP